MNIITNAAGRIPISENKEIRVYSRDKYPLPESRLRSIVS